ncbi:hypothetical protein DPMN_079785 [Dreissena polymorpha]|uniref:Uncharacterized protein n=1 Tax=Dreissena polymorpha TaxID=45954 RepID=A0A9D3YSS4_DREPO|nr:hypothetical protein DPMN_079785 [Dreissena polymorpha]
MCKPVNTNPRDLPCESHGVLVLHAWKGGYQKGPKIGIEGCTCLKRCATNCVTRRPGKIGSGL